MSDRIAAASGRSRRQYESPVYGALLLVWGDDIHVGMFDAGHPDLAAATAHTNAAMATSAGITRDDKVLVVACGVGGASRYLAKDCGARVTATNISHIQLAESERRARAQGGIDRLEHYFADFNDLPFDANSFDVWWCQDSLYQAGDPRVVLKQAVRVLKPGGRLVMSDRLLAAEVDDATRQTLRGGLNGPGLSTAAEHAAWFAELGLETLVHVDGSEHIGPTFARVYDGWQAHKDAFAGINAEAVEETDVRLKLWADASADGRLEWAYWVVRKPA
ncbi:MAG: class I SAM-dependent methyltransferase [Geminicoccaceae bacterium]